MTSTLSNLCDCLNSSLTNGDIRLIPPIILKIKQILSRNAKFTGDEAEIEFEKLSDDLIELKTILTAIKNYMAWVSKLKAMDLSDLNDGSEDFEILIGERNVPLIWDYCVDPIFIEEEYEHKEPLVQYLTKNNQRNIFTYSNGEIFDTVNDHAVSVFDAHEYFNGLDRVLGTNCQFVSRNRSEQADFIDYIVKIIGDVRSRRNTIVHLNNIWHKNQKAGFKLRLNGRSHEGLIPFIKDKNVLVVSPGPSLKHSINLITDECRKKFTIVAVAQSMPALAKYQVKPDFVIVVDPADFSYVLDDWDDLAGIKLIAEDSVHVSFLEKNFEEIYTVVTNKDSMGLDIYFGIPRMDLEGGTVPLAACSLAHQLRAASITLMGQDLTIGETNYFVAGGLHQKKYVEQNNKVYLKTSKKMEKGLGYRNDSSDVLQEAISVLGWNNETLYTSPEYSVYLSQFVNFASKINNVDLYNVSVGGANIMGFQNTILQDLIQKLPNNCSKLHKNSSKHITNVIHHQKFLIETRKDIINVVLQTRKAVSILERKNRIQDKKLGKLDNVEKKIIEMSKNNEYISTVVSDEIIRLNRAVLYVTNLDDNLDLSLKFYTRMVRTFSSYQAALDHALKCIDGLSLIEDAAG